MYGPTTFGKHLLAGAVAFAALASFGTANAGLTVLHSFTGGSDGANPHAGLIVDSAGNFYGTTASGGSTGCGGGGCGTVFQLVPNGGETVLYAFTGGSDGEFPVDGLIEDAAGYLYGTTEDGGGDGDGCNGDGCGTVFELAPDGTETILHAFTGGSDGAFPDGGVIYDSVGNLYGTTANGGGTGCSGYGCGTVFKLAPDGSETVLYAFTGGNDGAIPEAGLIKDSAGNLYGTTWSGGGTDCGCGTIFKLAPDGTETVLHAFGGSDGANPVAGLKRNKAGNLFGTTAEGGGTGCAGGCGTTFKLSPDGTETVLHAFTGGSDGVNPLAGLIEDKAGNLYGTTLGGGGRRCGLGTGGCGTVFKLAPDGTETLVQPFSRKHGTYPVAGLIKDRAANLYGTTLYGGSGSACKYGCGTVFKLQP